MPFARAPRVLLVACSFAILSCDGGPTEPTVPVAQVDVAGTPAENVLLVGGTVQLTATPRAAGGAVLDRRVTWTSSDASIATVSSTGLVTAVAPGIAVMSAGAGGATGAAAIAVRVAVPVPPPTAGAPVSTSLLNNTLLLTLAPGASATPTLTVGRAVVLTNDTRILAATAFAIGPAPVTFTIPASVEVSVNLAAVPTGKRAGLRLFRVTDQGDIEPTPSSGVDLVRGVVLATLARGGTYVVIAPGDPALLVATEGNSRRVEVGTAVPGIAVQARDAAGNPVPGASIEFRVEGTRGSIVGDAVAVTDIDGIATLPGEWIAGPDKGNYALRAQLLGTPLSVLFTATAFAPAVAVEIQSAPTSGRSGLLLPDPIIVELIDTFGDRAEVTQPVTITLLGAGGALSGTTQELAVLGGAIFQGQRIDGPGTYRIIASSAGLAPDTTGEITITQEVASLHVVTQPAGAVSGVPFTTQPVIELRDHAGLRVAGATAVVQAFAQGPGTLFGTREVAAVDGVATFTDLAVEGAGSLQLNFVSNGPVNVLSGDLTVAPAPPGIRLLVGGTPVRDVNPGMSFGVAVAMDLSNRGSADLAALDVTLTWDPARFTFVNQTAGPWRDSENVEGVVTADVSQVAAGIIRFSGSVPNATIASFQMASFVLQTLGTTATVESTIGAVVNAAANAAGAPVAITVLPMTVRVFGP